MNLSILIKQALSKNQEKQTKIAREYKNLSRDYRLGVMGGTFNPIHYGHLGIAQMAWWEYNLDTVVFIPAGHPPHKDIEDILDAQQRYEMTLLATASNPHFWVSRLEIDRPDFSYTVETLKQLQQVWGPQVRLYFILGTDSIKGILSWKEPMKIFEECTLLVATRPGFSLNKDELSFQFLEKFKNKIKMIHAPLLDISSTDIRQRIQAGKPIQYLLPEIVEKYIKIYNLYK